MYVQRRFPFKSVLSWTKREIIFFTIFVSLITALYELLDLKWLQIPFAPIGLTQSSVLARILSLLQCCFFKESFLLVPKVRCFGADTHALFQSDHFANE